MRFRIRGNGFRVAQPSEAAIEPLRNLMSRTAQEAVTLPICSIVVGDPPREFEEKTVDDLAKSL